MSFKKAFIWCFFVSLVLSLGTIVLSTEGEKIAQVFSVKDEYIIVIDPGHGGFDGGAEGEDGTVEKDVNLQISKALYDVISDYPVEVIMTRDKDVSLDDGEGTVRQRKRQDLLNRKKIIEEVSADLTISIHLNSYPDDELICGAQVFYPRNEQKRTDEQYGEQVSKMMAESVQKSLEINIDDGKERSAMAKDDVLLLKEPSGPIILVECGFLSNTDECKWLKSPENQGLLAKAIWEGINTNLGFNKKQKIQVIHSTNKGK